MSETLGAHRLGEVLRASDPPWYSVILGGTIVSRLGLQVIHGPLFHKRQQRIPEGKEDFHTLMSLHQSDPIFPAHSVR